MKAKQFFAIIAAAGVLVSCSKSREDHEEEYFALKKEAADIIMGCHTWDDAFAAADKLHAIADEMEELKKEEKKYRYEWEESELDMTKSELKIYNDQIDNKGKEANNKMNLAKEHINGNDAGKSQYLQYAIMRVN